MQVNFREGQDVKAGDLLIVIDPRPYQVALAQAKANLQKDEAQLTNAKAQYDRNKVLYDQGVIAKQDLDTMQASFGTYEGTIAADKAAIESAEAESDLLLHHVSHRWPRGIAPGRSRQLCDRGRRNPHAGHHPTASHCRGVYACPKTSCSR